MNYGITENMDKVHITETAFYKYLKMLSQRDRQDYLFECAKAKGEMFFELADYFDSFDPRVLAAIIEKDNS